MGEDDDAGGAGYVAETATQYLDKQGVDPRFFSEEFLEASEFGDPSSLRQLLSQLSPDETRELLRKVDQQGCTGLLLFAKRGDAEMVKMLLDAGAIVNDADTSGATALHYAASRGSAATIKLLLEFGAVVEAKDDRSDTPIMWARGAQSTSLLLEAGADANAKNVSGQTALMIASRTGDDSRLEVLARLPGVDLDAVDSQGVSAHAAAVAFEHHDAAELLVSLGAKSEVKQSSRITRCEDAFLEAARCGNADKCADFLREGMDIEAEVSGETALLLAAGAARSRAVEKLLECRSDPNHADAFLGETPLIRAVLSKSSNETLWMLLEAKADPAREDLAGRTAASVAAAWGYSEAADILKAAAAGELSLGAMD
jgi:ankyrin repeat protein